MRLLRREGSKRGRCWSGSTSDRREEKIAKSSGRGGGIITIVRVRGHIGALSPPRTPAFKTLNACLGTYCKKNCNGQKKCPKLPHVENTAFVVTDDAGKTLADILRRPRIWGGAGARNGCES